MLHGPKATQKRARALRKAMSFPEVLLWQALRKRPSGLKFRRQHPAGRYVLDFFCAGCRLAIEIDGEAHERAEHPANDPVRDAWLASQGVRVCRIPAKDVLRDLEAVVCQIVTVARSGYPSTAFGGPPSLSGED